MEPKDNQAEKKETTETVESLRAKLEAAEQAKSGIIAERHGLKDENRKLRAQLAEMNANQTTVDVPKPAEMKDPLIAYTESADYDPEMPIPARITVAHERFKEQKAEAERQYNAKLGQKQALERSISVAKATMTDDVLGDGYGFDAVTSRGFVLLDADERNIINNAGNKGGKMFYNLCLEKLMENDPRYQKKTETPETKQTQTSTTQTQPQEKAPTMQEVLKRQPRALTSLGLTYGD